jgi:7-carboxy-7-deazaguanine synthase
MSTAKKYRYSEIFGGNDGPTPTIQGEGRYAGHPTVWIRFWGCNLTCGGFGQANPRDPSTYQLDYLDYDPIAANIQSMDQLPVWKTGCDSSYSWSNKYGHLAHQSTAAEICADFRTRLQGGSFTHPRSGQDVHLAFTGGEPMMSQTGIVDIMSTLRMQNDSPKHITIETNGTQAVRKNFDEFFSNQGMYNGELFWSVSPKLGTSGEKWEDAIKTNIVRDYRLISNVGQLKFVLDRNPLTWDELERAVDAFRAVDVHWPVWIMPVGATREEQEDVQMWVTEEALKRGYNVAARIHCWIFSNVIGR